VKLDTSVALPPSKAAGLDGEEPQADKRKSRSSTKLTSSSSSSRKSHRQSASLKQEKSDKSDPSEQSSKADKSSKSEQSKKRSSSRKSRTLDKRSSATISKSSSNTSNEESSSSSEKKKSSRSSRKIERSLERKSTKIKSEGKSEKSTSSVDSKSLERRKKKPSSNKTLERKSRAKSSGRKEDGKSSSSKHRSRSSHKKGHRTLTRRSSRSPGPDAEDDVPPLPPLDLGEESSSASMGSSEGPDAVEKQWRFTQWFKKMPVEDTLPDSDLLSTVEFDQTGEFLATGDKGGRVVVLRADENKTGKMHYSFHCEFQSHDPEFDYVRSQQIDEKINKIKFLPATNGAQFMLTTNDRAIKLWKLHEKEIKLASSFNVTSDKGVVKKPTKKIKTLRLPRTEVVETLVTATPKRLYSPDIHKFNIHSLSASCDGSTFLSADNLNINRWSLDRTDISYNFVNIKPEDMQRLTEVITSAELETSTDNLFMYATNRGVVRLADMRVKALNDYPGRQFIDPALEVLDKKAMTTPGGQFSSRPFLSDMLRSISDVKFSAGGRYIIARDYMSVKIFDVNMDRGPVETIPVHDYLNAKLWDLYENEYIFDCFDVAISNKGDILTGSYNNYFHIYDLDKKTDTTVEASKPPLFTAPIVSSQGGVASKESSYKSSKHKKRGSRAGISSLLSRKKKPNQHRGDSQSLSEVDVHGLNYEMRILQLAWHPDCNAVAVAGENNLFLYAR